MATEKRLIDANALIASGYNATLDKVFPNWWELPDSTKEAVCKHGQYLKKLINELPTVDAVEVVRCKDCKFYKDSPMGGKGCHTHFNGRTEFIPKNDNDFCSYGGKKIDEQKDC